MIPYHHYKKSNIIPSVLAKDSFSSSQDAKAQLFVNNDGENHHFNDEKEQ